MRIAVIGGGVAGLGAAWLLRDCASVTLFEKAERLGGHSNTLSISPKPGDAPVAVDTGFIVYNLATYPNLIALFRELDVPTTASDMSFGVSLDNGAVEYCSDSLWTMIGHGGNIVRPPHWRMLRDLVRFYRDAARLYAAPVTQTLGEFLDACGYSAAFREDHLLPMAGAIWSAAPSQILQFPARSFGAFCRNHGLLELNLARRPAWRTVLGGSRVYVDKLARESRAEIITGARIEALTGGAEQALIRFADGHEARFDHVIVAAHADEALAMLSEPGEARRAILGAFAYSANAAYLHRDRNLMPRRRKLWASWNYLRPPLSSGATEKPVAVSYWMNRLQKLATAEDLFVTLNPPQPPREDMILARMTYHHPQFDLAAQTAQTRLGSIQGQDRLWFCGSYCGYGFHEDALASGFAVATALGGRRPWQTQDSSPAFANAGPVTSYARAAS